MHVYDRNTDSHPYTINCRYIKINNIKRCFETATDLGGGLRSVSLNGWKSGPMDRDRAPFHSATASSRDFSCKSGIDADCAMFLVRGDELGTD